MIKQSYINIKIYNFFYEYIVLRIMVPLKILLTQLASLLVGTVHGRLGRDV